MISCNDGNVKIEGVFSDILCDYSMIGASLINALEDKMGKEDAIDVVRNCMETAIFAVSDADFFEDANGLSIDTAKTEEVLTNIIEKYMEEHD